MAKTKVEKEKAVSRLGLSPDEYVENGKPTGMSVIGDDVRANESDDWWLEKIQHLLPPALRVKKNG